MWQINASVRQHSHLYRHDKRMTHVHASSKWKYYTSWDCYLSWFNSCISSPKKRDLLCENPQTVIDQNVFEFRLYDKRSFNSGGYCICRTLSGIQTLSCCSILSSIIPGVWTHFQSDQIDEAPGASQMFSFSSSLSLLPSYRCSPPFRNITSSAPLARHYSNSLEVLSVMTLCV